ncbi:hypothetical protein Pelo_12658 [Pelomyxa schiedti]|nr:hypothetical protein Pelo_12658 [Pelomyxa schiedti]
MGYTSRSRASEADATSTHQPSSSLSAPSPSDPQSSSSSSLSPASAPPPSFRFAPRRTCSPAAPIAPGMSLEDCLLRLTLDPRVRAAGRRRGGLLLDARGHALMLLRQEEEEEEEEAAAAECGGTGASGCAPPASQIGAPAESTSTGTGTGTGEGRGARCCSVGGLGAAAVLGGDGAERGWGDTGTSVGSGGLRGGGARPLPRLAARINRLQQQLQAQLDQQREQEERERACILRQQLQLQQQQQQNNNNNAQLQEVCNSSCTLLFDPPILMLDGPDGTNCVFVSPQALQKLMKEYAINDLGTFLPPTVEGCLSPTEQELKHTPTRPQIASIFQPLLKELRACLMNLPTADCIQVLYIENQKEAIKETPVVLG